MQIRSRCILQPQPTEPNTATCHIQDTRCKKGSYSMQRCSRCILQPPPTYWANKCSVYSIHCTFIFCLSFVSLFFRVFLVRHTQLCDIQITFIVYLLFYLFIYLSILFFCTRLYDIKNSYMILIIYRQIYFTNRLIPKNFLSQHVRVNLGVKAMKKYSTAPPPSTDLLTESITFG